MGMTDAKILEAFANRLRREVTVSRGTYDRVDPTSYERGTAWVGFTFCAPAPFVRAEMPWDMDYTPVRVDYTDTTWAVEFTLTRGNELDGVKPEMHKFSIPMPVTAMPDGLRTFLVETLCDGQWSAKEPDQEDDEVEPPREADFLV